MRQHLIDAKLCRADKIVVLGHGSSNGIESQQKFNPASYSTEDRLAVRAEHGIPADANYRLLRRSDRRRQGHARIGWRLAYFA